MRKAGDYAKDLFKKFGIKFKFNILEVPDKVVIEGWIWDTTIHFKKIPASIVDASDAVAGLSYISKKKPGPWPVIFTDRYGIEAQGHTPTKRTGFLGWYEVAAGVIINLGKVLITDEKAVGQVIAHEFIAHVITGGALHSDFPKWQVGITKGSVSAPNYKEVISCSCAAYLQKKGADKIDKKYIVADPK